MSLFLGGRNSLLSQILVLLIVSVILVLLFTYYDADNFKKAYTSSYRKLRNNVKDFGEIFVSDNDKDYDGNLNLLAKI